MQTKQKDAVQITTLRLPMPVWRAMKDFTRDNPGESITSAVLKAAFAYGPLQKHLKAQGAIKQGARA